MPLFAILLHIDNHMGSGDGVHADNNDTADKLSGECILVVAALRHRASHHRSLESAPWVTLHCRLPGKDFPGE